MKLRRRCWLLVNVPKWNVGGCVGWQAALCGSHMTRPRLMNDDPVHTLTAAGRSCRSSDDVLMRESYATFTARPHVVWLVGWRCTGNRINKNVYHHFELLGGGRKQQQKRTVDKCPLTRKQTRDALKSVGYCGIANGRGTQRWYRFTLFFRRTFNDSMDFLHSNQLQLCWFNFGKKCVVILGP